MMNTVQKSHVTVLESDLDRIASLNLEPSIPPKLVNMIEVKMADVENIDPIIDDETSQLPTKAEAFLDHMRSSKPGYILEYKPASPSKGDINLSIDIEAVVKAYDPFAAAMSVLVDRPFFKGGYHCLKKARQLTEKPLLCKDVIFDARQIIEGKRNGADIVLLMLTVLSDTLYSELYAISKKLGLAVITEVANQQECERLTDIPHECVGINHRNFADMSIDLSKTQKLMAYIPEGVPVIAESGLCQFDDFSLVDNRINNFLIGSSLMESSNIEQALRELLFNDVKVCGITQPEQAEAIYKAGATQIGIILYPQSPRFVDDINQFADVSKCVPLVAVFVNASIEVIVETSKLLNLYAVQLHGDENQQFVKSLKQQLPSNIRVYKAVHAITESAEFDADSIEQFVVDGGTKQQRGGSGELADWASISEKERLTVRLAGGLSSENVKSALAQGFRSFDFNSKIEREPGIKDLKKFNQCIEQIVQFRSTQK